MADSREISPGLRVGLLGGSFNPAHRGHLHISAEALARLDLDEVWWLVSPQNPLKSSADMAPLQTRLGAARKLAANARIKVTALEAELGTVYTADTLAAIKVRFPGANFVWLMGADNFRQIPRWKNWRAIFRAMPVAIFPRPSYSMRALGGKAARRFAKHRVRNSRARGLADMRPPAWIFLRAKTDPSSASAIRAGLENGAEADD